MDFSSSFFQVGSSPNGHANSCIFRVTTLGSATSSLKLMLLNRRKGETWGADHAVVIACAHWDAMTQRDERSYLLGEFQRFVALVEEIRADVSQLSQG